MSTLNPAAMLMTAGLGTRMLPFTNVCPKPLLPILGHPTFAYSLWMCRNFGIQNYLCNLHHLGEALLQEMPRYFTHGETLQFLDERALLLGSAGGIVHAFAKTNHDRLLIINADTLMNCDLPALILAHEKNRAQGAWLTLAIQKADTNRSGAYRKIEFDSISRQITALGEIVSGCSFYSGIGIMEREAFAHLTVDSPAEFARQVLRPAIQKGKAFAWETDSIWLDIGEPKYWAEAHFQLMNSAERDELPHYWQTPILAVNESVFPNVWFHHRSLELRGWPKDLVASGPIYWGSAAAPPNRIGQRAVIYDEPPSRVAIEQGDFICAFDEAVPIERPT